MFFDKNNSSTTVLVVLINPLSLNTILYSSSKAKICYHNLRPSHEDICTLRNVRCILFQDPFGDKSRNSKAPSVVIGGWEWHHYALNGGESFRGLMLRNCVNRWEEGRGWRMAAIIRDWEDSSRVLRESFGSRWRTDIYALMTCDVTKRGVGEGGMGVDCDGRINGMKMWGLVNWVLYSKILSMDPEGFYNARNISPISCQL